jgi:hypothetical protein
MKGLIISNPAHADDLGTIKISIRGDDKCNGCGSNDLSVTKLPQHRIGKKVALNHFTL